MKKYLSIFLIAANIIGNNADAMNIEGNNIAVSSQERLEYSMMSPILRYEIPEIYLSKYEDALNNLVVQKESLLDETRCCLNVLMGHNIAIRFDDFPDDTTRNQAIENLNGQILDIAKNAEQELSSKGGIRRYDELILRLVLGQLNFKEIKELSYLNALYHIRNSAVFVGSQFGMQGYLDTESFDVDVASILELLPVYGIEAPANAEEIVRQYIDKAKSDFFDFD